MPWPGSAIRSVSSGRSEALHWRAIPHAFPDHATYTAAELAFSPPLPLLMTEKGCR